mmetsp:Transcript_1074/g.4405  ORF Transcript_1074/g.4405 Transcript_1074/m.4405 type:complete len:202 (-) Transcript_1074:3495-4100(-)
MQAKKGEPRRPSRTSPPATRTRTSSAIRPRSTANATRRRAWTVRGGWSVSGRTRARAIRSATGVACADPRDAWKAPWGPRWMRTSRSARARRPRVRFRVTRTSATFASARRARTGARARRERATAAQPGSVYFAMSRGYAGLTSWEPWTGDAAQGPSTPWACAAPRTSPMRPRSSTATATAATAARWTPAASAMARPERWT